MQYTIKNTFFWINAFIFHGFTYFMWKILQYTIKKA
jgi:hypothetical protein